MADDQYAAQINADFLRELGESLEELEILTANMRSEVVGPTEGMAVLRSHSAKLQQASHWAHQPLVDLTLRRLENYITDLDQPTEYQMDDIDAFFDVIRGILDGEIDQGSDQAEFVRSLPARLPAQIEDVEHLNVEVLVVDTQKSTARIFARELWNCGYRVATAYSFFEALELSVRTRPDLVISSAVLDQLSGADLARAVRAISTTRETPFAVLTSFDADHETLQNLPEATAILRKDSHFGKDLADALAQSQIL